MIPFLVLTTGSILPKLGLAPFGFHGLQALAASTGDADRILGKGQVTTGGHPQGARLWRLTKANEW